MDTNQCGGCKTVIQCKDYIICPACNQKYDLQCANISLKSFKAMSNDTKRKWRCIECISKLPKTDNTNTPTRQQTLTVPQASADNDSSSDCSNVRTRRRAEPKMTYITEDRLLEIMKTERLAMKALIESSAKGLSDQLKNINEQYANSQDSLTFISKQYDDLRTEITDLKKLLGIKIQEVNSLREENKTLKESIKTCLGRIKTLEDENLKQQQWARMQNLELIGIPETEGENPVNTVIKVCNHLGIETQQSDIEFAHRVQPRRATSATRARPIVVRWKQRSTKDTVVAAARKHRHLTARDIGIGGEGNKIFINEHLTKDNKILLSSCKQRAREHNYSYVWTKNCRILVRKNNTSPAITIASMTDVEKIV